MPDPALTFDAADDGTLTVAGSIDETSLMSLRECLEELVSQHREVTVELTGVVYLPSAAIGLFVRARRQARERGGTLRIQAADGTRAAQLLRLTGVDFDLA